jgi:hypothetical protein
MGIAGEASAQADHKGDKQRKHLESAENKSNQ